MSRPIMMLQAMALTGHLGLLTLLTTWYAWLAPMPRLPVALVLLVLVAPLLLPLRGLLHGRPYTHAWASYLALFYLAQGIVEAFARPDERGYAWAEIILSAMFYTGAILFARYRSRELKQQAQTPAATGRAP